MTTEDEFHYDAGFQDSTTADPTENTSQDNREDQYPYDDYDYLNGDGNLSYYEADSYEDYLYYGFQFERPIYMYIWPVLVFIAIAANVLLIVILLKKNLRNSTNIVLIGIALAEALTLLVTIPTYVLAYNKFDDGPDSDSDVYVLTKDLCNVLMICKFFLSKWFRTVSVWLHCFLGFHRLMAIWRPFYFLHVLQIRWSVGIIVFLYACAPTPHVYRVLQTYASLGMCGWGVEDCGVTGCTYRWALLLAVDLVPCLLLALFTILIVVKLCQSSEFLGSSEILSKPHLTLRRTENKRSSILVTTIVMSLLIPEIPYVIFLTYMQVRKTHELLHEQADREFHTAYELLIAVSFTTNFFINLILNNTFRRELTALFKRCCGILASGTCVCRLFRIKVKVTYDLDGCPQSPGPLSPKTEESIV